MAQSKGAVSKGSSRTAGGGAGTVNVVLSTSTAKDLLNALAQAVGTGSKKTAKASPKATSKASSKAASKAAPKPASKAARKA